MIHLWGDQRDHLFSKGHQVLVDTENGANAAVK
jgi:hypothetical protein